MNSKDELVKNMIQLANLRGILFMQLMDELDIYAPEIEAARKGMKKYRNALIELAE
jgi:hypothetical protein